MIPHLGSWSPSPEMLAAYFDGECEGREDLALLKQRIEDWLATQPQAQADLVSYRRLLHLWQATTPAEPDPTQWALVLSRLEENQGNRKIERADRQKWKKSLAGLISLAAGAAAAAALFVLWPDKDNHQINPSPSEIQVAQAGREEEVLPVATEVEVTILRVEGADTHTVVVGELPLHGMLELLAPGEVALTRIQPDAQDNMLPAVRMDEFSTPLIWARLESEESEEEEP